MIKTGIILKILCYLAPLILEKTTNNFKKSSVISNYGRIEYTES